MVLCDEVEVEDTRTNLPGQAASAVWRTVEERNPIRAFRPFFAEG